MNIATSLFHTYGPHPHSEPFAGSLGIRWKFSAADDDDVAYAYPSGTKLLIKFSLSNFPSFPCVALLLLSSPFSVTVARHDLDRTQLETRGKDRVSHPWTLYSKSHVNSFGTDP